MQIKSIYAGVAEVIVNNLIHIDSALHDFMYVRREQLAKLVEWYWINYLDFNQRPMALSEITDIGRCEQGFSLLEPFYGSQTQPLNVEHPRIVAFCLEVAQETEAAWVLMQVKEDTTLTQEQVTLLKNAAYGIAIEHHYLTMGSLNQTVAKVAEQAENLLRKAIVEINENESDKRGNYTEFEMYGIDRLKTVAYCMAVPSVYKKFRNL